jgi:hypothetical protein
MKDRARQQGIFKIVICGGVVIASALAVAFAIHDRMASDPYPTGTIQITRQGSSCQRLVIDNSTGAINSSQQIPCGDAPKVAPTSIETAPSRHSSGARIDAIRDSFRNR